MKVADLTVGLEVAIRNHTDGYGEVVCDRGIVIDPKFWTKSVYIIRGERRIELRPEKSVSTNTRNGFSNSGIPIAIADRDGNWHCGFITPSTILCTWADLTE